MNFVRIRFQTEADRRQLLLHYTSMLAVKGWKFNDFTYFLLKKRLFGQQVLSLHARCSARKLQMVESDPFPSPSVCNQQLIAASDNSRIGIFARLIFQHEFLAPRHPVIG